MVLPEVTKFGPRINKIKIAVLVRFQPLPFFIGNSTLKIVQYR